MMQKKTKIGKQKRDGQPIKLTQSFAQWFRSINVPGLLVIGVPTHKRLSLHAHRQLRKHVLTIN
eukprot:2986714-Amphidinium_carterae.1